MLTLTRCVCPGRGVSAWVRVPSGTKGFGRDGSEDATSPGTPARCRVVVGNAALMAAVGVETPPEVEAHMQSVQVCIYPRPELQCFPRLGTCRNTSLMFYLEPLIDTIDKTVVTLLKYRILGGCPGLHTSVVSLPSWSVPSGSLAEVSFQTYPLSRVPHPQRDGRTCIMVSLDGSLAATLALVDPLKPEARGVVAALHRAGLQVHLVTGDNRRTAAAIASRLAIQHVTAECMPAGKAEVVKVGVMHLHNDCIPHWIPQMRFYWTTRPVQGLSSVEESKSMKPV